MRADNAVGRAEVFESFRLGMSEKLYVRSLWPARRDAERPDGESWESRARGRCLVEREHTPASGRLRRQWDGCIVSDASVVNYRKSQLREGRIEAALSMKDTGPESASRREGRSQRQ